MVMNTLNRKLLRDLRGLAGQATAIAVVVACGVMTLITALSSLDTLTLTKQRFYQSQQFGHVFAPLKRAPLGLVERIRRIPGVNQVEPRVVTGIQIEVPDFPDAIRGQLLSIPDGRQPGLNQLYIRTGSLPEAGRNDQVAISEAFAEAHGLQPGDTLEAIIHGRLQRLTISGIVLSPEFVYQIAPADILPDYLRYGVLWMNRQGVARATGLDGAFNDLVLTLQAGVAADEVIEALDPLLARYGGTGAYTRDDQLSHRFVVDGLNRLQIMGIIMPAIFISVAAFLLNVVVSRVVRQQRQQIAVLKAFGYTDIDIAGHYLVMMLIIVMIGAVAGIAMGSWLASGLAGLLAEYYRFPELAFRLDPRVISIAVGVTVLAAVAGVIGSVWNSVHLPPAEAMRPPAPARFRRGLMERLLPAAWLGPVMRMLVRNLTRYPWKAGLSVLGIALACSLLVMANHQRGAADYLVDINYSQMQRMDMHVRFIEPLSYQALAELRHLPGVLYAEGYRSAPATLRSGHLSYRSSLTGLPAEPVLRRILDERFHPVPPPDEGVLLTYWLADYLGVAEGDRIEVEIMEGHRRTLNVPVAGIVEELVGLGAYGRRDWLNSLLQEGPAISGAWLMIDERQWDTLQGRLREMPVIAGVGIISEAAATLEEYMDETFISFLMVMLFLAGSIAFAVVYNNARIAFTERARELATLRVMGFSQGEIGVILIGEITLLTLLALPLGWLIGAGFSLLLTTAISSDLFRIPLVLTPDIFAKATLVILAATAVSLFLIKRHLDRLDMITALKAIE